MMACPACGSTEIETNLERRSLPVAYGPPATFEERVDRCKKCGEEGDFSNENEAKIGTALQVATRASMNTMLDTLAAGRITNAYLERSLGLPARTVARWKAGEFSAAVLALMRTVSTFPWILEVAEANFDRWVANKKVIEAACRVINERLAASSVHVAAAFSSSSEGAILSLAFQRQGPLESQGIPVQGIVGFKWLQNREV